MVQIVPFPAIQKTGTTATIYWRYIDISTGNTIPTGSVTLVKTTLFRPDGTAASIANTDVTVSAGLNQPPTPDPTGTTAGVPNRWFYSVHWGTVATTTPPSTANSASIADCVGNWYVETTFTYEAVTTTFRICIQVETANSNGFSPPAEFTPYIYCTPEDVRKELMLRTPIDRNSSIYGIVVAKILEAEGQWDKRTRSSYRHLFIQDEEHDFASIRELYFDFPDYDFLPHPIKLDYGPIIPFDQSRRHKIEVYEGGGTISTGDPIERWTNWLGKSYGRAGDWWFDWVRAEVRIRKFIIRRAAACRITYEAGKPISQTSTPVTDSDDIIHTTSVFRYQNRGVIRIGDEYIFHWGSTQSTDPQFIGCQRGLFDTAKVAHPAGAEIYEIPDDLRELTKQYVAAQVARSETFQAILPDGGADPNIQSKVQDWETKWEKTISNYYQQWGVV